MSLARILLLFAALAATGVAVRATTVIPPDFNELAKGADYVVRGKVRSLTNVVRQYQGRDVPHTLVAVQVSEVIAGTPPAEVVLDVLGGQSSDGRLMRIAGVPPLNVGDEHIFFVSGNGTNFYPLYAVMHGLYPVKRDKTTGREYVARANGVPLSATAEVGLPLAEGKMAQLLRQQIKSSDALTPAEFRQSIRAARGEREQGGSAHEK